MFPFEPKIQIASGHQVHHSRILSEIGPVLTAERQKKIRQVVEGRCFSQAIVLESIYDRGNASAVVRSAEALGFVNIHMIESGEKFKESARVTAGADKWVEITKWKSSRECVAALKSEGKQIIVTHLSPKSRPIREIDFGKPSALVLGNEKDGVSQDMIEMADHCVILPMVGFVQSYNISVAGALSCYHIFLERTRKLGANADVNEEQKSILQALYTLRTQDSAVDILLRPN